ncbi:MAG: molecular chaperone HtpG [Kiritimatiellae bacterium]|nr:molecular chaperone HtpG [Kiritimatiellia bacterium]
MSKKTKKFKTEVQQLLDLVIHSLYSKKEIYLRELISNASDAIDRARFEALTDSSLLDGDEDWKIKIHTDKDERTITISDNGIGMSPEEVESNIGTIANSGTKNFLSELKKSKDGDNAEFIGQFGVGFYASFMVADKVTLVTKRAGSSEAVKWVSNGGGSYSMEEATKESRGTEVTLHLRPEMDEYMDEWKIRGTVKEYSDYISCPIVMDITRKEKKDGEEEVETITEETLNSMKAIWKKAKSDISDEEYNEFYKHVSHDYAEPMKVIHFVAEGVTEFRALLYIPTQAPADLFMPNRNHGLHLYVKNVFIGDNIEALLPDYLRFVSGVVDSSDLPLNVSREMLQDDIVIKRIRKSLVGKILGALSEVMNKDSKKYLEFYQQFGQVLKEGVHSDFENADKLKDLLLFASTKSEDNKPVTLKDYVERMPENQKEIYYLAGKSIDATKNSPHLEAFKQKDFEVLFFVDPIDEWVAQRLTEYDGKTLKAIDRGEIELNSDDEKKQKEEEVKKSREEYGDLLKAMETQLDKSVKEVRVSTRLTDSACCLVADENGMNANMERILRSMNQEVPESLRILEINPDHPLTARMKKLFEENNKSEQLSDYIELLYDQALISEGSQVKNPLRFTKLLSTLMVDG